MDSVGKTGLGHACQAERLIQLLPGVLVFKKSETHRKKRHKHYVSILGG
jgi:hypothetical protein